MSALETQPRTGCPGPNATAPAMLLRSGDRIFVGEQWYTVTSAVAHIGQRTHEPAGLAVSAVGDGHGVISYLYGPRDFVAIRRPEGR